MNRFSRVVFQRTAALALSLNHQHARIGKSLLYAGLGAGALCTMRTIAYSEENQQLVDFYPPIAPYETHYLKVSDLHTIHFSVYGNPNGKPVLFVHGGPGAGTSDSNARFFDPKAYKIILVDQRGCGKSTPFAELTDNSTYDSVKDFEKIRKFLKIDKWMVFGGSWGSTLSLAYAIEHPERVTELVLRGIFLLRKKEIDWYYQGPGANFIFPEEWELYENTIPENERGDFVKAYRKRLTGELGEEEKRKACNAWSIWEGRTSNLIQPTWDDVVSKFDDKFNLAFARIENHYFWNKGFFPRDGFLLEKQNIDKIRKIPTVIVQGRYDQVCPIRSAYDLKKAFPEAELIVTLAGHSALEPETKSELIKATDRFKAKK